MVRMVQTINGIRLTRSLIGLHGQINGRDVVVTNFKRGAFPWMVRERGANLICLGRGQTLRVALADAADTLTREAT